jgi:hypothetical protein
MTTAPAPPATAKSLILGPALITLAVTLLRLVGELQHWSPRLFSREAGGAGALVGIVWLVPVFGVYFAWKLAKAGVAPGAGRVIGHGALALGLMVLGVVATTRTVSNQRAQFGVFLVLSLLAGWIAYRGWPALGRTLLVYGVAARVPVALVMLVAIYANWGTHYDVAPPNFPEMSPFMKWLMIGLVPQLLMWIPFTIYAGMLCGGLALLAAGRRREAPMAGTPGIA